MFVLAKDSESPYIMWYAFSFGGTLSTYEIVAVTVSGQDGSISDSDEQWEQGIQGKGGVMKIQTHRGGQISEAD